LADDCRHPPLDAFDWTTSRLAEACYGLELPVRLGPPGLTALIPAARIAGPVAPVESGESLRDPLQLS
jgi:hypothetical protein